MKTYQTTTRFFGVCRETSWLGYWRRSRAHRAPSLPSMRSQKSCTEGPIRIIERKALCYIKTNASNKN